MLPLMAGTSLLNEFGTRKVHGTYHEHNNTIITPTPPCRSNPNICSGSEATHRRHFHPAWQQQVHSRVSRRTPGGGSGRSPRGCHGVSAGRKPWRRGGRAAAQSPPGHPSPRSHAPLTPRFWSRFRRSHTLQAPPRPQGRGPAEAAKCSG